MAKICHSQGLWWLARAGQPGKCRQTPKREESEQLTWSKHLQTLWMQDPLKNSGTYLLVSEFDLQLWNCWPTKDLRGIPFSKSTSTCILLFCAFYHSIAWKIYWLKVWSGCGGSQDVFKKIAQWQQNVLLLLCVFPCNVHWEVLHVLWWNLEE